LPPIKTIAVGVEKGALPAKPAYRVSVVLLGKSIAVGSASTPKKMPAIVESAVKLAVRVKRAATVCAAPQDKSIVVANASITNQTSKTAASVVEPALPDKSVHRGFAVHQDKPIAVEDASTPKKIATIVGAAETDAIRLMGPLSKTAFTENV